MRSSTLAAAALSMCLLAQPAQAVTLQEIIELSRAGLGADVLVALVETSDTVFTLDAARILELKSAGVPERVIVALVTKGRTIRDPASSTPAPAPSTTTTAPPPVIVVQNNDASPPPAAPVIIAMPVPYPVLVSGFSQTVGFTSRPHVPSDVTYRQPLPGGIRRSGRFINDGFGVATVPTPVGEPVYWGWGGKLRPDAWGQPRAQESPGSPPR